MEHAVRRPSLQSSAHAISVIVAVLLLLGLVMVYSTQAPLLARKGGIDASWSPLLAQGYKILVGLLLFGAGLMIRPSRVMKHHWPILLVAGFLLLLVCIPGVGARINGSRRWFMFGGLVFQPVELARIALIVFLAARIEALGPGIRSFSRGLLPLVAVLGLFAVLLLAQPDFGSALFFLGLGTLLLILGGARLDHLALIMLAGAVAVGMYAVGHLGHVMERMREFLNPSVSDHAYQSLLALGSGGVVGTDLGAGMAKLGYLPMVSSDFILAAIGEELGLIGSSLVVLLFLLFAILGTRIALAQRTPARFFLAAGVVISISTQAILNIAVVTGAVPTKGIALPFVSSGGSSLAFSLFGVGMLVALARPEEAESGEPAGGHHG
ncbi:MAG: FtsW/RodA/SpoVE family cell cycle protein [Planctomycetota bacterium]